ncbi:MAG: hypothetical protein ABI665_24465, partial [Vicinamibacterales bacterium]
MKVKGVKLLCVSVVLASTVLAGGAQQAAPNPKDPRIGLKGGFKDAGTASWNMELVSNLPKPDGFYDPAAPAGSVSAPEPAPG